MNPLVYLVEAKNALLQEVRYRPNMFFRVLRNLVSLVPPILLWKALYADQTTVAGMGMRSAISYFGWSSLPFYLSQILGHLSSFVMIWAAIRAFDSLGEWETFEVLFLYSLALLSYALAQLVVRPFAWLDRFVISGELDRYLIRPVSPFMLISAYHLGEGPLFRYLSLVCLALGVALFSLQSLGISLGVVGWVQFGAAAIGAACLQGVINVAPSCAAFWLKRGGELAGLVRWPTQEVIRYPISIYPLSIRLILTTLVPVAFINYYPSLAFLQKENALFEGWGAVGMTWAVAAIATAVAALLWHKGLNRYESSGS